MEHVKSIGENGREEDQKAFILMILSVVLAVVPFVAEVSAASAGLVVVGRAMALGGLAGNAALEAYAIFKDLKTPILSIFGLLMGVGRVAAMLERVAASYGKIRRDMDSTEIMNLGGSVHEPAFSFLSFVGSCSLRGHSYSRGLPKLSIVTGPSVGYN